MVNVTSAVRGPIPPMKGSGSRNPRSARLGIVWATLATNSTGRLNFGRWNARMPAGIPTSAAAAVETATSSMCCNMSLASSAACVCQKRSNALTVAPRGR
jgi:hypothetical protein